MVRQYLVFLFNGAMLGLLAMALQSGIFFTIGTGSSLSYVVASLITYVPLIYLNFLVQRELIFSCPGRFGKFVVANLFIMILVSLLSIETRHLINSIFDSELGDQFGFMVAALIGATPSFLIARYWVFSSHDKGLDSMRRTHDV